MKLWVGRMLVAVAVVAGAQGCASGQGRSGWLRMPWVSGNDADIEQDEGERAAFPTSLLKIRDPLIISLRGISNPQTIDTAVDEEGNVSLPYLDEPIPAAGKSPLQLERDIRDAYLGHRIYRHVSVNVTAPAQSYFIRGEIRSPGRYPLTSGVTIMQAVAAAGGYTDYSSRRRVRLIRDGETTRLNLRSIERNPENDMELRNGDVIIVPRSMF